MKSLNTQLYVNIATGGNGLRATYCSAATDRLDGLRRSGPRPNEVGPLLPFSFFRGLLRSGHSFLPQRNRQGCVGDADTWAVNTSAIGIDKAEQVFPNALIFNGGPQPDELLLI